MVKSRGLHWHCTVLTTARRIKTIAVILHLRNVHQVEQTTWKTMHSRLRWSVTWWAGDEGWVRALTLSSDILCCNPLATIRTLVLLHSIPSGTYHELHISMWPEWGNANQDKLSVQFSGDWMPILLQFLWVSIIYIPRVIMWWQRLSGL